MLSDFGDWGAVRFHPDRIDDRIGAAPVGHLANHVTKLSAVGIEIDSAYAARCRSCQSFGYPIDGDDVIAEVPRDPGRHVADGAKAKDGHRAVLGDVGVGDRLPGGGQDIGEVDIAGVWRPLGDFDVGELGLGHPKELGLSAWDRAVQFGEAEQRGTHALVADLGGFALGE